MYISGGYLLTLILLEIVSYLLTLALADRPPPAAVSLLVAASYAGAAFRSWSPAASQAPSPAAAPAAAPAQHAKTPPTPGTTSHLHRLHPAGRTLRRGALPQLEHRRAPPSQQLPIQHRAYRSGSSDRARGRPDTAVGTAALQSEPRKRLQLVSCRSAFFVCLTDKN